MRVFRTVSIALTLTALAPSAQAQTPSPAAPPSGPGAPLTSPPTRAAYPALPAGYAPPTSVYAPLPPGYAGPPGYSYPPGLRAPAPVFIGPATLPYEEGYPVPVGYHPEMRSVKGLIVGGAITLCTLHGLSATGALISGAGDRSLLVPIAGPFIEIVNITRTLRGSEGGLAAFATVTMALDGAGQIVGATMILVGLTQPKRKLVRNDVTRSTFRVTPLTMGDGGMGIGLVGTM